MSEFNAKHNRLVWFDIPVVDVDRASKFYAAVLDIEVHAAEMQGIKFSVLQHDEGNGGCLVPKASDVSADHGFLCYLNANGRLKDAVAKVAKHGGKVVEPAHSIGPHGFRAIVLDSEGNRFALHSDSDD